MQYILDRFKESSSWAAFAVAAVLIVGAMFVPQESWRSFMVLLGIAVGVGGFFYAQRK